MYKIPVYFLNVNETLYAIKQTYKKYELFTTRVILLLVFSD